MALTQQLRTAIRISGGESRSHTHLSGVDADLVAREKSIVVGVNELDSAAQHNSFYTKTLFDIHF